MRCKVCGGDVPVLREFCPSCGAPTDPALRDRKAMLGQGHRQPAHGEPPKRGRKRFLVALAALVGLGMVGAGIIDAAVDPDPDFDSGEDRVVVVVDRDEPRGAITIDADELYKSYREDRDAFEDRFDDREMVVTGEFQRIVPDGDDSLDLRLATSDRNVQVGVDLARIAVEDAKKLRPGQRVTVSCQGLGHGGDDLYVRDCAIQANSDDEEAIPASTSAPEPEASPSP